MNKTILSIIMILLLQAADLLAQAPNGFNYQAVIRDSDGSIVANTDIAIKISILEGSSSGQIVYSETFNARTSGVGTIALLIGSGNTDIGAFDDIQWGTSSFFIQTSIDLSNGSNFEEISTTQLVSVPYALHARSTDDKVWTKAQSDIFFNTGKVGIGTDDPEFSLDVDGHVNATGFLLNGELISTPWKENNDAIYYNSGNLGLGTDAPNYLMDIGVDMANGNRTFLNVENYSESTTSSAALEVRSGSQENYTVLRMHGDNYDYSWWGKHGQLRTVGDGLIIEATKADNTGGDIVFVNGATGGNQVVKTVNMKIEGDGKVGIGTESPMHQLDVNGNINATGYLINGELMNTPWSVNNNNIFYSDGNTGLGTDNPSYKLDVVGRVNATEFLINGAPLNLDNPWDANNGNLSYVAGNVGIGTSSPSYLLDLNGNVSSGNRTFFNIQNNDMSTTSSAALEVKSGSSTNYTVLRMHGDNYSYSWWGRHGQLRTTGDGLIIEATKADNSGGDIVFVNGATGGNLNIKTINMMIDGTGNVGIGTENPESKLQVKSGDIYLEDINRGVIMKSPDGNCWRLTIDNTGNMVTTSISCP